MSENVASRIAQHNDGISKWTEGKGPWTLVWTSEAKSITDARKPEKLRDEAKGPEVGDVDSRCLVGRSVDSQKVAKVESLLRKQ